MGFVKIEQQGHVGILTIDRQEALNALNSQVLSDLDAAIDEVAANDDIYVVILTGAGRSFVAGADIGEMKGFSSIDGKKFGVHGGGVFLKLENMAKPVLLLHRRQEVRRPRRRRVPEAGEHGQARYRRHQRLRSGRRQ